MSEVDRIHEKKKLLPEAVPEEEEAKHRRTQERSRAEVVLAEEEAFRNHCQ